MVPNPVGTVLFSGSEIMMIDHASAFIGIILL